jgi:hypothetical protein
LVLAVESGGWKALLENSEDPVARALFKDTDFVPSMTEGIENVTRNVHSDRQSTFLGSKEHLEYIVKTNMTPRLVH